MAVMFKKLFGNGQLSDEVKGELRTVLLQMRQERNAFETAAQNAAQSVEQAQNLIGPMAEARRSFVTLEPDIRTAQGLVPQIRALEDRAAALEQAHLEAETEVRGTTDTAGTLRRELEDLRMLVEQVLPFKEQLQGFLEMASPFQAMQADAEHMRSQMDALMESFGRMAEAHARHASATEESEGKIREIEERTNAVVERFEVVDRRTAELQEMSGTLEHLTSELPEVRRNLGTLEALADHVTQRVAVLEEQREAVDRATAQAEHLSDLIRRLDRQTKKQEGNVRIVAKLRDEVGTLEALHGALLERTDEIAERQREIDTRDAAQREQLEAMRQGLEKDVTETMVRFEFEREGMDAVRHQVAEVRRAVVELEERRPAIDEMRTEIDAVESRRAGLSDKLNGLATEVARIEGDAERVQRIHGEVDRVARLAKTLARRMDELEAPAGETLDLAERRVEAMDQRLQGLEARAGTVDATAERAQAIGRELDGKQVAIEGALAQLERAAKFRDVVEQIVTDLKMRTEELTDTLAATECRASEVRGIMEDLDRHAPDLGAAREQLARFEQRFQEWRIMEDVVDRALVEMGERHQSIEQVRQEIVRLHGVAGEAMDMVRSVLSLKSELTNGRESLEGIVRQLREVKAGAGVIEERRHQVTEVEERLVRAEAAVIDIRHSIETLHGQRAFLDQVMETAGALRFQTKQAEALILTLREEAVR